MLILCLSDTFFGHLIKEMRKVTQWGEKKQIIDFKCRKIIVRIFITLAPYHGRSD
jgi:preprotein translocase subunit SecE